MRQLLALPIVVLSILFSPLVHSASDSLIVTGSATWEPFSFINDQGQPDGIMVDYWKLYAEANDVTVHFNLKPWSESLEYASTTPNVVHGGLGYTSQRSLTLQFSHELPLRHYEVYLFVQKDLPFDDLRYLETALVGTVKSSTKHEFLTSRISEKNTRLFNTFGSLNEAAYRGEIDMFIDDYSSALYHMRLHGQSGLFTARRKLYSFPLHFAMEKASKQKLTVIEQGLRNIDAEDIEKIYEKWLLSSEFDYSVLSSGITSKQVFFLLLLLLLSCGLLSYRTRFKTSMAQLKNTLAALQDSNERLQFVVQNDPVTGAKTRHQFFNKLREMRFTPSPYVVAVIGLDHLKFINEHYGQDVGDMALKHLATQMRLLLNSSSTVGRLGGGKFAILFELSDRNQALKLLQKLQIARQLKSLYIDQQHIRIQFCYGLTSYPNDSMDGNELLKMAMQKLRENRTKDASISAQQFVTQYTRQHSTQSD